MAKKITKSLEERLQDAKSFHEMIDLFEAHGHETTLASLAKRRQRFDSIQGNKKIPAAYRKQFAELEWEILSLEQTHHGQDFLRPRKRDLSDLLKRIDRHLNPPKAFAMVNAAYKVGGEYARQSLTRAYDGHVWEVLDGYFESMPRTKGQKGKIKIVASLPEKVEYLQLKQDHFTKTIALLVDEAYEEIADLRDEMQEAFDNTPESLQETEVAQARSEAASQLDIFADDSPSVPESISSVSIILYPSPNQTSRADRAGGVAVMLRDVSQAARQFMAGTAKLKKAELKEIREFCDQLEAHADEIENVEFPGMFG